MKEGRKMGRTDIKKWRKAGRTMKEGKCRKRGRLSRNKGRKEGRKKGR